jgi:hypothetical protein
MENISENSNTFQDLLIDEETSLPPEYFEPFLPARDCDNRSLKRQYVKELAKIHPLLNNINILFLNQLFDDELEKDYDYIFKWYNQQWLEACEWFEKTKKIKLAMINKKYFYNKYAPIEKVL